MICQSLHFLRFVDSSTTFSPTIHVFVVERGLNGYIVQQGRVGFLAIMFFQYVKEILVMAGEKYHTTWWIIPVSK